MKKLLALLVALLLAFSIVGCSDDLGGEGGGGAAYDPTKSQLNISCWNGGFGVEWLETIARRFEEYYKDHSFEPNKTGVQIKVIPNRSNVYDSFASNILNSEDNEIAISEQCNYNGFAVKKSAIDITEEVTTPLTEYGEKRSIADKLSAEDQAYYGLESNTYYGLPWYESTFGIQYDKDLFEEERFYFAAEGQGDSAGFIKKSDTKRSNGPDGIEGTADDGLPATYDEFFRLCDKIANQGMTPVVWAGVAPVYLNNFLLALAADYEGYDQMKLNYSLNGTAIDIVDSVNADGSVNLKSATEINNSNGYLLKQQAGYYYGLQFLERLLTTKKDDGRTFKYFDPSKSASEKGFAA